LPVNITKYQNYKGIFNKARIDPSSVKSIKLYLSTGTNRQVELTCTKETFYRGPDEPYNYSYPCEDCKRIKIETKDGKK